MRILADENIPRMTVEALRDAGHDVREIRGTADEGAKDNIVWQIARADSRLLISTDKGFAGQHPGAHSGVLIVRLRQPNRAKIHERVMSAMKKFGGEQWRNHIVVMRDAVLSSTFTRPE